MRFQAALENMGDGLAMFDADERLVVCNSRYGSMYGLPAALQRVATPYRDIVSYRVKNGIMAGATSDLAVGEKIDALRLVPRDTASGRIEELSDGRLIRILRQPLEDGGWVGTHEDVTDRHRNDLKISFMANHDPLTGLANRTFFNEKIEYAVARLRRHGEVFAVLMLDLDRFKNVNDTLGHQAGDRLLQETAQRLRSSLRETDVVARLGGDEFAIIQAGEKSPREGAAKLAARMSQIVSRPHDIDGNIVSVGVSIGIALAPDHARESRDLLRMADLALYRAKAEGRNAFRFFDAAMATDSDNRRELEAGLRAAITRGEFVLHYQPIVDAKTRRPAAFEALIRWRHPTRGLIPPGDFIPLAEETGLIVRIGQWVLQQACADAAKWPAAINVAVNLSPVQLATPELLQVVRSALVESGLAPERLELEITETALFRHEVDYVALLRQLKKLGVSIALDDFGTGYSSLSSVTMFPVDRIKIDRSFIMNLTKRADCAAIVATVLALGRAIDARTVAEGVETEEQFAILRANGVDFAQGYLFGRPCQVSDIGFDDSDPLSPAKSAA
jgi:diguanylate cyclase (GGDEF)-like protein